MKRYAVYYERHDDAFFATLYVTKWGRVAKWLHLPDRHTAKFTEMTSD